MNLGLSLALSPDECPLLGSDPALTLLLLRIVSSGPAYSVTTFWPWAFLLSACASSLLPIVCLDIVNSMDTFKT